jgi:tRNA-modifying protein YgfZ
MQPPAWLADYNSLRAGAGYTVLPNWSIVEFTGRDRGMFLNNFCTNGVRDLAPGQIREVFITDVKGHTIGYGHVVALDESLLFVTVPEQADSLIKHFDRYIIREQVTLSDRTSEKAAYSLPGSASTTSTTQIGELMAGGATNAFDSSMPRPESKLLFVDRDKSDMVNIILSSAGFTECCFDAWSALRIENGFPLFTTDITSDNLPQEVDRDKQAISFTKGCYLGQETVARIDALGQVNKLLRGIRIDGDISNVALKDLTADGKPVGRITSSTYSPQLNATLALGYVKRQFAAVGTKITLENISCEVIQLPLK